MRMLLIALLFATTMEPPETILSNIYPNPGKDAELERVLRDNVAIMKKLDVIEPAPVVLVKQKDHYVMLFTWKSASIPDNAPPEIKKNWAEMRAVSRIEFEEVTPLVVK